MEDSLKGMILFAVFSYTSLSNVKRWREKVWMQQHAVPTLLVSYLECYNNIDKPLKVDFLMHFAARLNNIYIHVLLIFIYIYIYNIYIYIYIWIGFNIRRLTEYWLYRSILWELVLILEDLQNIDFTGHRNGTETSRLKG